MNEYVGGLLAIIVLVVMYKIAKMDNIIGSIFRTITLWNFWFKLFSLIPLCGWMSHFIVTNNKEEEIQKKEFQKKAASVREENAKLFNEYTERRGAEIAARKAKMEELEQQELQEKQDWVKKQAWKNEQRTDVEFSRDGKRYKYSNESWDKSRPV